MKKTPTIPYAVYVAFGLLFAVLLFEGCNDGLSTQTPNPTNAVQVLEAAQSGATLQIVEHQGHRFCVLMNGGRIAVCEVTDASLIEKK